MAIAEDELAIIAKIPSLGLHADVTHLFPVGIVVLSDQVIAFGENIIFPVARSPATSIPSSALHERAVQLDAVKAVALVHVAPSGEYITRLVEPEFETETNKPRSDAHTTLFH